MQRHLGRLECYHWTRERLGFDTCVVVAREHDVRDSTQVQEALAFACKQLPVLTMCVQDLEFHLLPEVDLAVEWVDIPLVEAITAQHKRRFTQQLWRVCIVGRTVIFAYHHVIGDGMSGCVFHEVFAEGLMGRKATGGSLALPIEDCVDLTVTWRRLLSELLLPKKQWGGSVVSEACDFRMRMIQADGGLNTAYLVVAVQVALSNLVPEDLTYTVPVSLRPWSKLNGMGDHVSAFVGHTPADPVFSWDRVSRTATAIKAGAQTCGQEIGLLKYLFGYYNHYFKNKLGRPREVSFEVSNLGRQPGVVYFSQHDAIQGAAIKVSVVNRNITIGWNALVVSDDLIDAFVSHFSDVLAQQPKGLDNPE